MTPDVTRAFVQGDGEEKDGEWYSLRLLADEWHTSLTVITRAVYAMLRLKDRGGLMHAGPNCWYYYYTFGKSNAEPCYTIGDAESIHYYLERTGKI